MRTNPFSDVFLWLADARWEVLLLWALLIASITVAAVNWRGDPAQRTPRDVTVWVFRVLIGAMWYQGTTWKLPLPVSGGFEYWLRQTGEHAAFPFIGDLVNNLLLPQIALVGPLIYFAEMFFAVSLLLGVLTRLGALFAAGQALFLWLGLYRAEAEWPWNYIFLAVVHGLFIVVAAGRSLGVDAILRRPGGLVSRATGFAGLILRQST
ncbi:MAG: DoxX family membrane protein [Thiocapsa sp.]|jgi:uncharacterized membrane protein YphA (DoxX/SURF4 family)|nr:TQO small subunit DoxD [Thiocapsa sp.]MCG6897489.1 DoxX family membrane protein [Thiocapsa sp.]